MIAKQLLAAVAALFFSLQIFAQQTLIRGRILDADGKPVAFSNVALFNDSDQKLVKAAATDDEGSFAILLLEAGVFTLKSTFVGLPELSKKGIAIEKYQTLDLGELRFSAPSGELAEVVVSTTRPIVEARPDRTIFNVQGTINATGSDGLSLLRKAPAVVVDNNDNLVVLGRSGVLVYVDGKRLPLAGADLSNYLQNLTAEQIDRIEIITSPGAKYDAQGNAGIIDIRLKKDKNLGANGSVSSNFSQGVYHRLNNTASGNFRNKKFNVFGNAGWGDRRGFMKMDFTSTQNGIFLDEKVRPKNHFQSADARLGADFFLGKKHTLGVLVGASANPQDGTLTNEIGIGPASDRTKIDSVLLAETVNDNRRNNASANVNYRFDSGKGRSLNVDFDLGRFQNTSERGQTNRFFGPSGDLRESSAIFFDTPTDIEIFTAKADFEDKIWGGVLGLGAKFSRVASDNDFLVYDENGGQRTFDDRRSNLFNYDEKVAAAYASFQRPITKALSFSSGLRYEKTDATGDLQAFRPDLQEPKVILDYGSLFPSAGVTWARKPAESWTLGFSRRINRPDYQVLNPFYNQLSQLSFEKGNPNLQPEIVNNAELGLTLGYRFSFKLGYSLTTDQITRLIGPDDSDPRANYISWENLAEQRTLALNVSAPFSITKKWDFYVNATGSHIDNQADYGDGKRVDVQVFTYNFYAQNTFKLGKGWNAEVSGWYAGPGVWGGVFLSNPCWSLDLGLQKKFLRDRLSLRLTANDVFYRSGWSGISTFDGLVSEGSGRWDARRGGINLSYNFGNQNVKSRKRKTGLEDEAKRVGSGG